MFDQLLLKAIIVSLSIHLILAGSSLWWGPKASHSKRSRRVEISYKPVRAHKPQDRLSHRVIKPAQNLDLKNADSGPQEGRVPIKLSRGGTRKAMPLPMYERPVERVSLIKTKRVVSIPQLKSEKMNNPVYAAYSQMVRERIKKKVYQNFSQMESGIVYLTFVVGANGVIKDSQIIDQKTVATQKLMEVSLRSLKDAGPFPPFPKGMNLPDYTFNIEIQYQVGD